MNRKELLHQLSISEADFQELVTKLTELRESLKPAQRSIFDQSLPTMAQVAQAFGPGVTVNDIADLLGTVHDSEGVVVVGWCGKGKCS